MILLASVAAALTLEEAVARAGDVDPDALVATLEAQQLGLGAAEAWSALGPTPSVAVSRAWEAGASTASSRFSVSAGLLDATLWFDALQESSEAEAGREIAKATRLDAQYAAAVLYLVAFEAQRAGAAARASEAAATATLDTVRARAAAGLDSALMLRSATAAQLVVAAERETADGEVEAARVRLARALQLPELGELAAPPALTLPEDGGQSPWLAAARADVATARWRHAEALAGWLPVGSIAASTPLDTAAWRVTLGATWTFDGLAGPFLRERSSALGVTIAKVQLDALERDHAAAIAAAAARARAAEKALAAHTLREEVAGEALALGQAQLAAGLASTLDVLQLQEALADARADRVQAELAARLAVLEARHAAGTPW